MDFFSILVFILMIVGIAMNQEKKKTANGPRGKQKNPIEMAERAIQTGINKLEETLEGTQSYSNPSRPVVEPVARPVSRPMTRPVAEQMPKPVSVPKSATKSASRSLAKSAIKSVDVPKFTDAPETETKTNMSENSDYISVFGTTEDLMVKGFDGSLSFDRDFLSEGLDMIAEYSYK